MHLYKASSESYKLIPIGKPVQPPKLCKIQKVFSGHCLSGWEWPPAVFQDVHRMLWTEPTYPCLLSQPKTEYPGEVWGGLYENKTKLETQFIQNCQWTTGYMCFSMVEAGVNLPFS